MLLEAQQTGEVLSSGAKFFNDFNVFLSQRKDVEVLVRGDSFIEFKLANFHYSIKASLDAKTIHAPDLKLSLTKAKLAYSLNELAESIGWINVYHYPNSNTYRFTSLMINNAKFHKVASMSQFYREVLMYLLNHCEEN